MFRYRLRFKLRNSNFKLQSKLGSISKFESKFRSRLKPHLFTYLGFNYKFTGEYRSPVIALLKEYNKSYVGIQVKGLIDSRRDYSRNPIIFVKLLQKRRLKKAVKEDTSVFRRFQNFKKAGFYKSKGSRQVWGQDLKSGLQFY
jgi:hypothetical protein